MVKSTKYKHFLIILWLYGLFNVLKTLYGAVILWFEHFLDFWAEICQIFRWFFGKFKKSKRHSEIIWPLQPHHRMQSAFYYLGLILHPLCNHSSDQKSQNPNYIIHLIYCIVASTNTCYYSENQIFVLKVSKLFYLWR